MLARKYVYWPNINEDIETCARKRIRCQETAKKPLRPRYSDASTYNLKLFDLPLLPCSTPEPTPTEFSPSLRLPEWQRIFRDHRRLQQCPATRQWKLRRNTHKGIAVLRIDFKWTL
ncbi:unnamed protein product [Heligmosomoides polygyrus]|uniref:Integrase_H2C2 domain-containing protein n=1 Tax=Heligmosomoides polygyrus TaxID=6339 RepID=A0A183FXU5_HELPZ|nr:unnamed protein product [Heligmosomoides polygyrus]